MYRWKEDGETHHHGRWMHPRSRWFPDWNTEHWRRRNIGYSWLLRVSLWLRIVQRALHWKLNCPHTCADLQIEWETQRAGAWLNVSNQRTFLCIIKENMQWIYQPFSPIYQQQAAVVWRKSIHPSKAAFCFGSILILKCFKACDLFFSLGGRTAHTNYPVSLLYISNKRACPENMVTSRHTWTRIYGL